MRLRPQRRRPRSLHALETTTAPTTTFTDAYFLTYEQVSNLQRNADRFPPGPAPLSIAARPTLEAERSAQAILRRGSQSSIRSVAGRRQTMQLTRRVPMQVIQNFYDPNEAIRIVQQDLARQMRAHIRNNLNEDPTTEWVLSFDITGSATAVTNETTITCIARRNH